MANDAWFRFWTADWSSGTSRLTNEEVGAYLRLVLDYYKNGPLPNDQQTLMPIAHVGPADWVRIWGTIKVKFVLGTDGLLHNPKCDEEIKWRHEASEKRKNQTRAALASRGLAPLPNVTSNVTSHVTSPNGTMFRSLLQGRESESESESNNTYTEAEVENKLASWFERKPTQIFSYAEQTGFCELKRRFGLLSEIEELDQFRRKGRNYFPRSLQSLLARWDETLDRARTHDSSERSNTKEPQKKSLLQKLAEEL